MDHIDQAIYATVHESAISAKEIAQKLGMSHQILINKANPQSEFHKLTLRESLAIQLITGNHRICHAMTTELGIDERSDNSKLNLLESALSVSKESGDVMRVIHDSISDGAFTLRERETCQKEIDEAIDALNCLKQSVITHK